MNASIQSIGGQIMAKRQREQALAKYYNNPNICANCHEIIHIRDNEKVSLARIKKYCSRSCAAKFNNSKRNINRIEKIKIVKCKKCTNTFNIKNSSERKVCDLCLQEKGIGNKTKKEFFSSSKNWQSARSSIRRHAEKIYKRSNQPKRCLICLYVKHYQVSHVRAVSDFPDDTLIKQINDIRNLLAFCPTHHWEYDHNELDKTAQEIVKEHILVAEAGFGPASSF
jgi:hypothetical protein